MHSRHAHSSHFNTVRSPSRRAPAQFLKAQASYLQGLTGTVHDPMTVHFLCTERLNEDISRLIGVADAIPYKSVRAGSKSEAQRHNISTALSLQQENVVRHDMMPWDTMLHELVCHPPVHSIGALALKASGALHVLPR